ncbi:MAG: caspase family protein [Sphingobacteriales bacterium]|nr:caspase family protein [Sphingobacteriales bacterium]
MRPWKKICLLAVGALFSINCFSISIYEISYEFKNLTDFPKYTAFLVRYGNGTGFMRVRYMNKSGSEIYVVDMEFNEVEGRSKIDGLPQLTLQFKGKSPRYIINTSGKKDNEAYNPDVLWFKKRPDDKNFKPWGVTSQNTDGTFEYGKILNVKVLNTADLTKTYVKQYFLLTESFYVNLFKVEESPVASTNIPPSTKPPVKTKPNGSNNPSGNSDVTVSPTKPQPYINVNTPVKLHFILVANTNDPRIGYSVQKDVVNLSSQIKDVSVFLKIPLNFVEVSGANFNKKNVENAINNLKPGPNDIVIFYYSGHGYSIEQNTTQQYPQFDLRESRFEDILVATLNASDVMDKIKAKNARLNLVLSDCCNSNLGMLKPEGKTFALTAKSLLSWDKTYCYNLFMNSKGSIIATAAKKGQFAYGNTDVGGYFTSNFVTAMEKYLSKFQTTSPTWEEIIDETQATTITLSMSNVCAKNTTCRQDPVFAVNVSK